ncbi:MAG TPA: hypothetical protein VLB76_20545 [Thermoanaerobaculia bacterium]|nr:hypothetical protein [Thermoanaerobaculia bacterium]
MITKTHLFSILLAIPLTGALLAAEAPKKKAVALPVDFTENRFYVTPVTAKGETLRLYTDSGGGLFLLSGAVKRLGLPAKTVEEGPEKFEIVELPAFRPEASIPPPIDNGGGLPVLPPAQEKKGLQDGTMDGMLGQGWFAGRVWTWDYPGRRLLWLPDGGLPAVDAGHRVSLGFKADKDGQRLLNFPRIAATIDGDTLDLLFDTGATVTLSPEALAKLGDKGPASRGTSFVAAVHFDAWRQKHPTWRVIENADLGVKGEPMIEVPAVTVAGYTVGPVWFTRRPDPNFHQGMSQYMDRQVEGALGGSALRFFRVTVDYPNAVAVFERP